VGVFVTVVLAAYHYSLISLVKNLSLDTPLAYIGLVPAIALGLAAMRARPLALEPPIHDRQVDYIVGLPLVVAAVVINLVLPRQLSTLFWVWRIDLLSLPLFVGGVTAIVFGVRVLWRQRLAICYLLLAWPLPYTGVMVRLLNGFTNMTLVGLKAVLRVIPVASPIAGTDGSLFQVIHAGKPFPISVVSACSGVNGMVGFLLVGVAFVAVVKGSWLRKTLWLLSGLALLWIVNLGRLLLIFAAGGLKGEQFALNVLHPFVGLVTFNLGVAAMLLALRPFGLRIHIGSVRSQQPSASVAADPSLGAAPAVRPSGSLAVPNIVGAVVIVALIGGLLGFTNSKLSSYDLVATATGEPKLASFSAYPGAPAGWQPTVSAHFEWAKSYFGGSSSWLRYTFFQDGSAGGHLYSNIPVTADVVNTSDLQSFSAYGVEACYRFHGFHLRDVAQVKLGGGITGQALSYSTRQSDWTVVYWIWPTKPAKEGGATRYERVILYLLNTQGAALGGANDTSGVTGLKGALSNHKAVDRQLMAARSFLVTFARDVVQAQAKVAPGSRLSLQNRSSRGGSPSSADISAKPPQH
jgi:exosortase/archaeosortase family protein